MKVIGFENVPYDMSVDGVNYKGSSNVIYLEKKTNNLHDGVCCEIVKVNSAKWSNVCNYSLSDLIGCDISIYYNKYGKVSQIDIND